jgi:hypothetical protein
VKVGRKAKDLLPLSTRQQRLAASFHPRALAMAADIGRGLPSVWHDDMRSAAGWGCVFAAAEYRVSKQGKDGWSAWAYHKVKSKIFDAWRSCKRRHELSYDPANPEHSWDCMRRIW